MAPLTTQRRRSPWLVLALALAAFAGCDQMNRPLGAPSRSSSSPDPLDPADGGAPNGAGSPDGGPAPTPSITAQPGDVHL